TAPPPAPAAAAAATARRTSPQPAPVDAFHPSSLGSPAPVRRPLPHLPRQPAVPHGDRRPRHFPGGSRAIRRAGQHGATRRKRLPPPTRIALAGSSGAPPAQLPQTARPSPAPEAGMLRRSQVG